MKQKPEERSAVWQTAKWLGILLFFGLPLAYLVTAVLRHFGDSARQPDQPHVQIQKQSMEAWESIGFLPLSNKEVITARLRSTPIRGQALLNSSQQEELYSTILKLVDAFSLGSFQTFMAFRLPVEARYVPNEAQMKIIRTHWHKRHSGTPAPGELELFRWWVETQSGGDFYRGFWQGICFSPQEIYAKLGTTNEIGVSAKAGFYITEELEWAGFGKDAVYSMFHAGLIEYPPSFKFTVASTPAQGGVAGRKELAAALYFFVKPAAPDPVLPIGIRYVWDRDSDQWLPVDLVVGNLHIRSKRNFVF